MTIVQRAMSGEYGYRADFVGDSLSGQAANMKGSGAEQNPFCSLTGTPLSSDHTTLEVVVGHDVPFLFGFATTKSGGYPSGARTSLLDTEGNVVPPSTDDLDSRLVVYEGDNVSVFIIARPAAGTWTMTADYVGSDAYVFLSTMPTEDAYATMFDAIAPYIDQEVVDVADGVGACWACKIVCWGVATVLAALMTTDPEQLTATSAPVSAVVAALSGTATAMRPATVAVIIRTLATVGATTATILVLNFCSWLSACNTATTSALKQPPADAEVRGQVNVLARTQNADLVVFLANGNNLGIASSAPYQISWDTTRGGNGQYTLMAMALQGGISAMSAPVEVNVYN
jgi:hypothetical protein